MDNEELIKAYRAGVADACSQILETCSELNIPMPEELATALMMVERKLNNKTLQ